MQSKLLQMACTICVLLKPGLLKKKRANYVSNFQLFKCTIQLENSLADRRVQFKCTDAADSYPSSLEKTTLQKETLRFGDILPWMAPSQKAHSHLM